MTVSTPVQRVVDLLTTNGYRSISEGLKVGALEFEFAAILVGDQRASDLILVADAIEERSDAFLRRQVLALARALDLMASKRPLTLVVVGPRPNEIALRDLARVSRVLLVGTPTGEGADASIRDALAVLLPLALPAGGVVASPPLDQVRAALTGIDPILLDGYMQAASSSTDAVEQALKDHLIAAMEVSS